MAPASQPRMTLPTKSVLRAMLDDPTREMYGLQISQAAELPSGTVHPILARLETYGWLESRWEDVDPRHEQRPRRRYYRLTPRGVELSRNALAQVVPRRAPLGRLRPGLAGGV